MLIEFIQANVMLVLLFLTSGGMMLWSFSQNEGKSLAPNEASLLMNREEATVLDVREPDEFASGHLPNALNIPLSQLTQRQTELEAFKEFPLLVCCASGGRSGRACSDLNKKGFKQVHNLAGGISAWRQAGLPVRKPGKGRHK